MNVVIDAAAAIEYLLKTKLGERVTLTLDAATLFAPDLVDAEVLSVLRREVLKGRLDDLRAAEALEDLSAWDVERIKHRTLLEAAWDVRHNVSGYDAFYVAAARLHNAMLVTVARPCAEPRHSGPESARLAVLRV